MLMWTIVNSLSQVADHPMSSPCSVDRAGLVCKLPYSLDPETGVGAYGADPIVGICTVTRYE